MPTDGLRVACVQLNVSEVKDDNVEKAERLVARAAAMGANVVVLPEMWNVIGSPDVLRAHAEPLHGGPTVEAMRGWARRHGVTLVGGSICERRADGDKLANTCVVLGPDGAVVAVYRKIHLFDVVAGGHVYRESDVQQPGSEPVACDAEGWRLGLTICYDLRFPELYRVLALAGAELVTVAADFTLHTGMDHWQLLLRARAVENQCFVAAAAQWGVHPPGRPSYGRSVIVDPWGVVLAQAPDADTVIVADVERTHMEQVRRVVPSLANRQPEAYRWPADGSALPPVRRSRSSRDNGSPDGAAPAPARATAPRHLQASRMPRDPRRTPLADLVRRLKALRR